MLTAACRERRCNLCRRQCAERDAHSARADGRQDRVIGVRHEDEEYRARRLLKGLEEAVRRRLVHAVCAVDEDDPPFRSDGCARRGDEDVAHGIRADHRCTLAACLGCDLKVVGMHARRHCAAGVALPAGRIPASRTEQCPREDARRAPLADALRTAKEQGMGQTARHRERTQPRDDLRVSTHVRPVLRKRLPHGLIADRCGHSNIFLWTRHYI